MKNTTLKLTFVLLATVLISACGSSKKNYSLNVLSDPLGAYALMQVKYKQEPHSDWIFLGPTPIDINRPVNVENAIEVSLKVIRPGFHEQIKTWKAKDFYREHKDGKKILWVPNMVKQ